MAKTTKTIRIGRSAITGEFKTLEYAKKHPKTTIIETIKVAIRKKKK